jgi:hypothetical protein
LSSPEKDRRQYQRVRLVHSLPGRIGTTRVFVVDASLSGVRVAHQAALPPPGQRCLLLFDWEGRSAKLECEIVRTFVFKQAKGALDKTVYQSGMRITATDPASAQTLRELIAEQVARALDEQKANARGIPATAAQSFQTGKGTDYLRFELVEGLWNQTPTTNGAQPPNGFTISADEEREHVEMLCQTFASCDAAGRRLIQTMAELSISKAEGIPTRRYMP